MRERTVNEIIDSALYNAKLRFKEEPKQRVIKRTGNKKALHQKSKNRRPIWN